MRALDADAWEGGEVIAPTHDAHFEKLVRCEPHEGQVAVEREIIVSDLLADAVGVHFEEDTLALVRDHVGVFGDDAIDEAVAYEVGHLCIRLVGRDDTRVALGAESVDHRLGHLGGDIHCALIRLVRSI